jgi:hypothetical protein
MRKILTLIFIFTSLAVMLPSRASADLGRSVLFDPARKEFTPALTQEAGRLTGLFGTKGFDLDLATILSTTRDGAPIFGYAALGRVKLADQLSIRLGPALLSRQSEKLAGGFFFSFELKF